MKTLIDGRIFEWNDEKAALNVKRHGLTFQTAALVFEDEFRIEEYNFDGAHGKNGWQAIGAVENVVIIVFSDCENFTRIISARKATPKETEAYKIMSTVNFFLPKGSVPTSEQKIELATLGKQQTITFDKDCMPFPRELDWELMRLHIKYKTRLITKEILMAEFPERFQKHKSEAAG